MTIFSSRQSVAAAWIAATVETVGGRSDIFRYETVKRVLGHPLFWLSLVIAVTIGALAAGGGLEPQKTPDTLSFLKAAELGTLVEALANYRSMGYPAFLRLVVTPEQWLSRVPVVQVGLYFLSLYLFWFAVERLSGSGWFAFAATLPLPWAGVMTLANVIQPDFSAAVATIVAISCLMLLVTGPSKIVWGVGVAVGVFAAYQLRPAAVFLVAMVPLLGVGVRWLRDRGDWRGILRWSVGLAALTLVPYLLFCGLRWVAVGHFGVVSFGGTNLAGIAASFVDGRVVRELPQEHRALARRFMSRRAQMGWKPMRRESDIIEYFGQYSDNIWRVARPAGKRTYRENRQRVAEKFGDSHWDPRPEEVVLNEMLGSASKAIIRLKPKHYFKWVTDAIVLGLRHLLDYAWIVAPLLVVLLSLPILLLRQGANAQASEARRSARTPALLALLILGVGYFAAYLLLVSLVSFPAYRYFVSMTLFLPSAICVQLFEIWRRILTPGA